MEVDYLFLIPLTPSNLLDKRRSALQNLCFNQLRALKSKARFWLLSDEDIHFEDFETIKVNGSKKEEKLWEAAKILEKAYKAPARYLVRLDDDDLINPNAFEALATGSFDAAYDHQHVFYDLSSARCSSQKRPWMPNTSILSYMSGMTKVKALGGTEKAGDTNFLIACDHSQAWHPFFKGKKIIDTSKNPLYLRILSPGTITSSGSGAAESEEYSNYLKTFGNWQTPFPFGETHLKPQLVNTWIELEGELIERSTSNTSLFSAFIQRIKSL